MFPFHFFVGVIKLLERNKRKCRNDVVPTLADETDMEEEVWSKGETD
jgi:hypothetical protein